MASYVINDTYRDELVQFTRAPDPTWAKDNLDAALTTYRLDHLWIEHLTEMDYMRQGIGLQAYGQRDPLVEYKRRAYQMFQELTDEIRQGIVSRVFALEPLPLSLVKEG